jgi:type IV secretion system protein VirB6
MSAAPALCADLVARAGEGAAPTLQAVDCMAAQAGAGSFGHLFGAGGVLAPVLTVALTLFVAGYGLALLTGRVRLGLGGLSGRMLALGLVLAFSTSWAVYGPLVTALAMRAPDQVAGAILGSQGLASVTFAQRIDIVYSAVTDATREAAEAEAQRNAQAAAAQTAAGGAASAPPPPHPNTAQTGGFAPASVAGTAAMILLLTTAGVLVTARVVLAALLLCGPVFVVMALFGVTRGLFAGWCRTLALAALAPLLVVLGGAFTLELVVPQVARLLGPDGIDSSAATGFFLIATVHASLMVMALRAVSGLVAGWSPLGSRAADRFGAAPATMPGLTSPAANPMIPQPSRQPVLLRGEAGTMTLSQSSTATTTTMTSRETRTTTTGSSALPGNSAATSRRAAGIGSRFRAAPARQVAR